MRKYIDKAESWIDNLKIKNKFFMLFFLCVLLPLIITDSYVIYIISNSEKASARHEMENAANAVNNSVYNSIEYAAGLGKNMYTSRYIDKFLNNSYTDNLEYVNSYRNMFVDSLLSDQFGMDHLIFTLYTDNDTVVDGGHVQKIGKFMEDPMRDELEKSSDGKVLDFIYDDSMSPAIAGQREIIFLEKLDFFEDNDREKVLKIKIDYSSMIRNLASIYPGVEVYVCRNDRIVLSNGRYSSSCEDFNEFTDWDKIGYRQELDMYGVTLMTYVMLPKTNLLLILKNHLLAILMLLLVNIFLPLVLMRELNRSFTFRIRLLGDTMKDVESEHLHEITGIREGKDEIGALIGNYNKMAARLNALIQIVYKNRLHEQEILVAKQNAELLALHSQINPHFLFNALESIRMHSIIRSETETADMVEKLAVMQRQYVDWGDDCVSIAKEMEFVAAYLDLQKYRFGDRLSFRLEVEEDCRQLQIPKLSIVTFAENACVHGIESKTSPGWIFVRVYQKEQNLYLEVEDTGIGMPEERMKALQKQMQGANISMLKQKERIGMINACLRLKMFSQGSAVFLLEGEENIGMTVHVELPVTACGMEVRKDNVEGDAC